MEINTRQIIIFNKEITYNRLFQLIMLGALSDAVSTCFIMYQLGSVGNEENIYIRLMYSHLGSSYLTSFIWLPIESFFYIGVSFIVLTIYHYGMKFEKNERLKRLVDPIYRYMIFMIPIFLFAVSINNYIMYIHYLIFGVW